MKVILSRPQYIQPSFIPIPTLYFPVKSFAYFVGPLQFQGAKLMTNNHVPVYHIIIS